MNRGWAWALICILSTASPDAAHSIIENGLLMEGPATLARGAWSVGTYLEFSSGAQPITVNGSVSASGTSVPVKVDSIRLPVEVRYGLSDNFEIGGDLGFESDDGEPDGSVTYFNGSGLEHLRLMGKWNFFQDVAGVATLAFLGDNELYYGLDSLDFGLRFVYGPQVGAGTLNMNLGMLMKNGSASFRGANAKIPSTSEDYQNVFSYGIGYIYPYSDRFTGVFEFTGSSSPYKGGGGVNAEDLMSLQVGMRYGFTEQLNLKGGMGVGIGDGSPNFLFRIGMDWLWGAFVSTVSEAPPQRWEPSGSPGREPERRVEKPAVPTQPEEEMSRGGVPAARGQIPMDRTAEKDRMTEPAPATLGTPPERVPPVPAGPTTEEQLQARVRDAADAFNRGDLVSAASNYESAIRLKDGDAVLHYNLATTYFQMKRYADAKTYFKNALAINPNDADSRLYLGYTYYYLQDQASAIREWQKVLEIDPTNTLAKENLRSLGLE